MFRGASAPCCSPPQPSPPRRTTTAPTLASRRPCRAPKIGCATHLAKHNKAPRGLKLARFVSKELPRPRRAAAPCFVRSTAPTPVHISSPGARAARARLPASSSKGHRSDTSGVQRRGRGGDGAFLLHFTGGDGRSGKQRYFH